MATRKKRTNTPRAKVPYKVWSASYGHRDNDPVEFVLIDGTLSRDEATDMLMQIVEEWIDNEEQYLAEGEEVDAVVYGPFLESFIKTVKDLPRNERADVERDLRMEGFAYLPTP